MRQNMLPWCYLAEKVRAIEGPDSRSPPMREQRRTRGRRKRRRTGNMHFMLGEVLQFHKQTHTVQSSTSQACLHLRKCVYLQPHTRRLFSFSRIESRRLQRRCSWIIYGCPSAGSAIIKLRPRLICSLMRWAFSGGSWANIKYILFLQIWLAFYRYCY